MKFLIIILVFASCAQSNRNACQSYCGLVGIKDFKHIGFTESRCNCNNFNIVE